MAKIEVIHPADKNRPASTESIEVRIWGLGGTEKQQFFIGSGCNYQANGNIWVEILYCVEGAQIFYTRNFLHEPPHGRVSVAVLDQRLDELIRQGEGRFWFGDMLPETRLSLVLEKYTYKDEHDEERVSIDCALEISADTGAVFGFSSPGTRSVNIKLDGIEVEEGADFMRTLIREIDAAQQGRHPDPADFSIESSEWPLIWQLNQRAYNQVCAEYQEDYLNQPLLTAAFENWLARLPGGASILDAGCGHGNPVLSRLIEKGFEVTGSDFSPEMLRKARQQYPQARFLEQATTMLTEQAAFDGICSFNSVLYLDPIDLLRSIYRFHAALKPGGFLFLYAFDPGPGWRGVPYNFSLGQWMWCWHYGMQEAADMLQEHGYFQVLDTRIVQVDEGEAERMAQELEKQKKEEEEFNRRQASAHSAISMPYFNAPIERSPYAYVVIARRCEK